MCQEFDIKTDKNVVPQIGFYFAGGIGNTGSVCGAVAGAVMALGIKLGRPESMEEALGKLAIGQEFRRRFEAEMETISCRELTGMDLSTPEGVQKFMESDVAQTVCPAAVGVAYKLVVDLLKEQS